MKKILLLVMVLFVGLNLMACNSSTKNEAPLDLSDLISVEQNSGELFYDTELAENELGRKFEFYTHQRKSQNVMSFKFYDKNANLIAYANVTIETVTIKQGD